MPERSPKRGKVRRSPKLAIGIVVESAGVKRNHDSEEPNCHDKIEQQMKTACHRDQQPQSEEPEEDRICEDMQQQESAVADAIEEGVTNYFEPDHYFTSTIAASLVAIIDG